MAFASSWRYVFLLCTLVVNCVTFVLGDGSDWISVNYIVQQSRSSDSTTSQALAYIVRQADQLVGKGPWSITNEKNLVPPSKNPHDYLSWAPYHWPDCRWCSTSANAQGLDTRTEAGEQHDERAQRKYDNVIRRRSYRPRRAAHRRPMHKMHRRQDSSSPGASSSGYGAYATTKGKTIEGPKETVTAHASNTKHLAATSQAPTEAAAKTGKPTCTPSPTTSMAPSATWTTCPYIGKDGKVNSDVRALNGPSAINMVGQYALFGSIAFATKKAVKYSQGVVDAIETFFLNPDTKMNPNVNYGQMVRGPGPEGVKGTFTGVLDLRGVVKVINSIFILKSGGSAEWTSSHDQEMRNWLLEYGAWLQESVIGKKTSTRPNNHITFYVAQVAAAKYYTGDMKGAVEVLQHFFKNEFRDQIATSGEQPFEGIRAKPVHYRAFNLEALIMNAKLGDALGVDFWSAKSKYGATIQTALDYAMARDPKGETLNDLVPHVAAVAAAYGDPKGKYKAWMKKQMSRYESKAFWFYDQPSALAKAPSSGKNKRRALLPVDNGSGDPGDSDPTPPSSDPDSDNDDNPDDDDGEDGSVPAAPAIPFTCPDAFKDTAKVEIDNGIFVTCEQMRPLYEADVPDAPTPAPESPASPVVPPAPSA